MTTPHPASEAVRTRQFVSEIRGLADRIEGSASPRKQEFSSLCKAVATAAEEALQETEAAVAVVGNPGYTVEKLSLLEGYVEQIACALSDWFEAHVRVVDKAREIYYLCDWLLDQVERNIEYAIVEGSTIATSSFLAYVYACFGGRRGVPMQAPALWSRLRKIPSFHFVVIPARLTSPDSAMLWAVVLHELGHAIFEDGRLLDGVPELKPPEFYYDLITLATSSADPPLAERAQRQLHALEYGADMLATLVLGPGFPWCVAVFFARRVDTLSDAASHPKMLLRLAAQCDLLSSQGFETDAQQVREHAAADFADFHGFAGKTAKETASIIAQSVQSSIRPAQPQYDELVTIVRATVPHPPTADGLLGVLRAEVGPLADSRNLRARLRADFSKGRPVIVDPATQYYMVLPQGDGDDSIVNGEMFADCFKLFYVKSVALIEPLA